MSKRRVFLASACSTTLLAACYFTTSFEGLSSGGPASDGGDATSSTDAGVDAPRDASTEAAVDAGSCIVPGLTTRLCDDFERATTRGPWTSDLVSNGGSIEITTDPTTKSRVFHSRAPRVDNGLAQAYQRLDSRLKQRVHLEFDLRYTNPSPPNARQLAVVNVAGAGKVYVAMFVVGDEGMTFYEQVDPGLPTVKTTLHPLKSPPLANAWHHFSLDLDLGPNTVTLLVDGTRALPADEVYDFIDEFVGEELTIRLGPSYSASPSSEIDTFFDNVLVASD